MKAMFRRWTFLRTIRVISGLVIALQGALSSDPLMGMAGAMWMAMGFYNLHCCVSGSCRMKTVPRSPVYMKHQNTSHEEMDPE